MTNTVLLSRVQPPDDGLRQVISEAGFPIVDHVLGSAPPVEFDSIGVAVIEVQQHLESAVAQTRRWRAELGDEIVPILWVIPTPCSDTTVRALEAGADAVLAHPAGPAVLLAQLRAMLRSRATGTRLATKATEARLLGDQLRKAYARLEQEHVLARRIQQSVLPRVPPMIGTMRFAVVHRSRTRAGGDFYQFSRLDETHVGFLLGDVTSSGSAGGSLVGMFARQVATFTEVRGADMHLVPPDELLAGVNRELLALGLEEPPLVAMLAGVIETDSGKLSVAREGLPAPIYLPASGEPEEWSDPGPFLGTADVICLPRTGVLRAGDRLIVGSDGTRPDGIQGPTLLQDAAIRHRDRTGQEFAEALAAELLPRIHHGDDFTLLVVERTG